MSPLREKYQRDMAVRGLAARTQQSHTSYVADLARYHHRSPDQIAYDEVVDSALHLWNEKVHITETDRMRDAGRRLPGSICSTFSDLQSPA